MSNKGIDQILDKLFNEEADLMEQRMNLNPEYDYDEIMRIDLRLEQLAYEIECLEMKYNNIY